MEIGREIRQAREAKGWSQTKLAAAADMGVSGISQIETGTRNPSVATLSKIAKALEVEVADLFPKAQAQLPLDVPFMARPQVREWKAAHGHMTTEEFSDYVEGLDLDIDEEGWPRGLERAIKELRQTRDRLIDDLKRPTTRDALFPKRTGLPTKEERIKEALRPAKEAWEEEWKIRHEYLAREVELINYGRRLHEDGETSGYLEYEHRLEAMLEEAYAQAGAA